MGVSGAAIGSILGYVTVIIILLEIVTLPMYSYSGSCMTLTAQAYGNKRNHFKYLILSTVMMYMLVIPSSALLTLFSVPITKLITNQSDIIHIVSQVIMLVTFINLFNGLQMMLKSNLQSLNLEKWVRHYANHISILPSMDIFFWWEIHTITCSYNHIINGVKYEHRGD